MDFSDSYKKYFLYSISIHALILILLLLFGGTVPPPPPPTTQVTMLRLSRGVGDPRAPIFSKPAPVEKPAVAPAPVPPSAPIPVAKPAPVEPVKPPPPAKPPTPPKPTPATVHLGKDKPPPKSVPAKPPAPAPLPTQPAPSSPDEKKIADALSGIKTELEAREAPPQPAAPPGTPGEPGTGQTPAFGSPTGDVNAADPGYAQYQSSVRSKIIREWIRTSAGPEGEQAIRARIQVRINASGAVISKNVVRSSGNESFDLSALRAIERASPLPPPPEGIKAEALSEGFVVDFSSRMLGRR